MPQNGLIIITASSADKAVQPLSLAAIVAARTLLVLCKTHPDAAPLSVTDALRIMDGDPGLSEIADRLPRTSNDNNPEARAIVAGLVEEATHAARDMLQHYNRQPTTEPQLRRLRAAASQAPGAAKILDGILTPEFKANAAEPAQDPPREIRAIKALRYIAVPLQI